MNPKRVKILLNGLNIREFSKLHGIKEHIVRHHLFIGKCAWPRIERDRRTDSNHELYGTFNLMRARCYNKRNVNYKYYGGCGITVCNKWRYNFTAFVNDMGPRPEGYTLDRIDSSKSYCPENCRWAPNSIQSFNIKSKPFRGVRLRNNRWQARITHDTITYHIGTFDTLEEAQMEWTKMALQLYGFVP